MHIVDMGLSLLFGASLLLNFWGESFSSTVHIINNPPTSVLLNKSPHETLFLHKPDFNFIKVFGCDCYSLLRPYNHHKFDFRLSLCLFLGYSTRNKGYICLQPFGKIILSHHVFFNEYLFPYSLSYNFFLPTISFAFSPFVTFTNPLIVVSLFSLCN